jgi:DNA-binding transcriptional MocR family regulator
MFSAHRGFTNCLRLNYGHPWDVRAEAALTTLGRLVSAYQEGGKTIAGPRLPQNS